uniref:HTH cro/C1-type domain-containing protein n=2 Tax=Gloeothece TaxID=28070 RepID=E0UJ65_GLOV7|nr:hypothetical protein Cyan7822_3836 [Gloeothece verrucosa PCC 7822]
MLDELLEQWGFETYNEFADFLGIHRQTLWRYRQGIRELQLNTEQMQKLQKLLKQAKRDILDLPLDWYLDKKDQDENTWEEPKAKK